MTAPRIGVLALQGDVREHVAVLERVGADAVRVRRPEELAVVDGLVLPGGESSVIDKLSRAFGLFEPVRAAVRAGLPVFGTCAGLILLAERITGGIDGQRTFGGLDVTVDRNAFGGQNESFDTALSVRGVAGPPIAASFIRAPVVTAAGPEVEVLSTLPDGRIVAVRQGGLLGTSFHPETTGETRVHELFLSMVADARSGRRAAGRAPA